MVADFDWGGFTRNLAIGPGVFAVCAIGALSTTAMKAGEEISTGNVQSAGDVIRDVRISVISGFKGDY